jgi:hypothetical protein
MNQKNNEKIITPPIIRDAQFMVSGDTGETEGRQRTTLKKQIHTTLMMLSGRLNLPRLKGPLTIS